MIIRRVACVIALALSVGLSAQQPDRSATEADARRVADRIRALQAEADRLAGEARTLLGDLRTLEIERELQVERVREATAAIARGRDAVAASTARIAALDQARVAQLPNLESQLVDIYKRGRAGYATLLFGTSDVREFGRATRAVAALIRINQDRIARHRETLKALQQERAALEAALQGLEARAVEARAAQAAADRALSARTAFVAQIDRRRDLNAQLAGELQVAAARLQQQLAAVDSSETPGSEGAAVARVAIPLAPFRGALEWPVAGRIIGAFGTPGRFGSGALRNGIDIAAPEGTAARAIHPGTVSFADAFTGFGNLVIVDHGANTYSLYGYLGSLNVAQGDAVAGGAEVGRVGLAPAGAPALYLEIRVDGRSVDPVQWLRPR
jgi:septal ring factor EnvC (AmiA/AmiB activator)